MEKIVSFSPAYNKGKEYGIGAVQIRFVLKGELGAVQFLIGTDWYLPADQKSVAALPHSSWHETQPRGWDLGYHSPKPMYEEDKTMGPCEYLDGRPCYYDGSGLAAEPIRDRLLAEGDVAVWEELTRYYVRVFGEER